MNTREDLLRIGLKKLEKHIPHPIDEMLTYYQIHKDMWLEKQHGRYVYLIFAWPEKEYERIVLLVFEGKVIIADLAAVHCSQNVLMNSISFYDEMSEESDWMYLEHDILNEMLHPELDYPFCKKGDGRYFVGEALLYTNAYVTRTYRRQGILREMDAMARAFTLRKQTGMVELASIFAMDPDVACYGPDTPDKPYIYSFEQDEPVRLLNAEIAKKIGYEPLRMEEIEPDPEGDGTKLWFCIHRETSVMI